MFVYLCHISCDDDDVDDIIIMISNELFFAPQQNNYKNRFMIGYADNCVFSRQRLLIHF